MDLGASKGIGWVKGNNLNKSKNTLNKNRHNFRNKGNKVIINITDINKDKIKYWDKIIITRRI